ncbi:olfactory receptor 11A1-like [Mantella aurantiaca]
MSVAEGGTSPWEALCQQILALTQAVNRIQESQFQMEGRMEALARTQTGGQPAPAPGPVLQPNPTVGAQASWPPEPRVPILERFSGDRWKFCTFQSACLLCLSLTREESLRRRQWNLCFYCGTLGHYIRECPVRPGKPPAPSPTGSPLMGFNLLTLFFLSICRAYDCPIELLPGTKVPYGQIFPYLDDSLKKVFIHPSSSPVGAGIFFVEKKDHSLRPCIDYRKLNKITVKNRYPLPLVPELLQRLRSAKMAYGNQTLYVEVLIVGFENLTDYRIPLFLLLLIIYTFTCVENLLIIFLVCVSPRLHCPMYILIGNLLLCEFVYTTDLVPLILHHMLSERAVISHLGCSVQLSVSGAVTIIETLMLTLMSCDRYLAICKPLRYSSLIHNRLCLYLVTLFWFISFIFVGFLFYFVINLEFCGPLAIDHFFCDFNPYVSLACSDIMPVVLFGLVVSITLTILPFLFIVLSYVFIIFTILRIKTSAGRRKAFSTCSSHLLVVTLYYTALFCLYVIPRSSHYLNIYKGLSFTYFSVTPMINPIIYTLKNQEVHKALQAAMSKMKTV